LNTNIITTTTIEMTVACYSMENKLAIW